MKSRVCTALLVVSLSACLLTPAFADIKKGDKLQTLSNLHPDPAKNLLYTLNYQLPAMIPVCSEVIVTKVGSKELSFTYHGLEYTLTYEGFTKKAGVSFQKAAQTYLGAACDKAKMQSLSKLDQEGIQAGRPKVGMTRDGVLFAMGRPPIHVNPDLNAREWHYWKNRFATEIISFDEHGKVSNIE